MGKEEGGWGGGFIPGDPIFFKEGCENFYLGLKEARCRFSLVYILLSSIRNLGNLNLRNFESTGSATQISRDSVKGSIRLY